MKKTTVWCLRKDGITAINFDLSDLLASVQMEFEDQGHMEGETYEIFTKEMTEKEIEELPEFEGF